MNIRTLHGGLTLPRSHKIQQPVLRAVVLQAESLALALLERVAGDVGGRQGEEEGRGGGEGALLRGEVGLPDEGHVEVERAPDPLRGPQRVHAEVLAARDVPDPDGHGTPPNGDALGSVHVLKAPDCLFKHWSRADESGWDRINLTFAQKSFGLFGSD